MLRQKQELYVVHSLIPVKFLVYSLNICSDVNMPHGLHLCFDSDSTVSGKIFSNSHVWSFPSNTKWTPRVRESELSMDTMVDRVWDNGPSSIPSAATLEDYPKDVYIKLNSGNWYQNENQELYYPQDFPKVQSWSWAWCWATLTTAW